MAEPFSRLITALKKQIPGVAGECSGDWGAAVPNARKSVRNSLMTADLGWNDDDIAAIGDLSQVPRPYEWSVSISHTHDMGGWLAVPRPAQIGWDVELKTRIKKSLVKRVCSPVEVGEAPSPLYLWSAKEAFYKALEDDQPAVVTQLTVTAWLAVTSELWSWQGLGPRNGMGLLLDTGAWTMAACLIP